MIKNINKRIDMRNEIERLINGRTALKKKYTPSKIEMELISYIDELKKDKELLTLKKPTTSEDIQIVATLRDIIFRLELIQS